MLALLRNDKSRPELRDLCTSELEDFLKDGKKLKFIAPSLIIPCRNETVRGEAV